MSPDVFPRQGEYDLVCHNCCPNLADPLYRSTSAASEAATIRSTVDTGRPQGRVPRGSKVHGAASYPGVGGGAFFHDPRPGFMSPAVPPMSHGTGFNNSPFTLANLPTPLPSYQRPFVGMCLVDVRFQDHTSQPGGPGADCTPFPPLPSPSLPPRPRTVAEMGKKSADSSPEEKPILNPEAPVFSPISTPELLPRPSARSDRGITDSSTVILPLSAATAQNTIKPTQPLNSSDKKRCSVHSMTRKSIDDTLEELRKKIGIGEVKEEPEPVEIKADVEMHDAMHDDPANHLEQAPQQPIKKKTRFAIPISSQAQHQRRRRQHRRGKRAGKNVHVRRDKIRITKDTAERKQSFVSKKYDGRTIGKYKNKASHGSRYWNMMKVPNWREGASAVTGQ